MSLKILVLFFCFWVCGKVETLGDLWLSESIRFSAFLSKVAAVWLTTTQEVT
ncbi:hypothetical protein Fmac_006418 [Flemingia macrophylla]|uniref:Uncharacterized protein n=1 Tax=Flemingia macrophylla TaxID=520843 RepID=A0ABD1NAI8_9FABA